MKKPLGKIIAGINAALKCDNINKEFILTRPNHT